MKNDSSYYVKLLNDELEVCGNISNDVLHKIELGGAFDGLVWMRGTSLVVLYSSDTVIVFEFWSEDIDSLRELYRVDNPGISIHSCQIDDAHLLFKSWTRDNSVFKMVKVSSEAATKLIEVAEWPRIKDDIATSLKSLGSRLLVDTTFDTSLAVSSIYSLMSHNFGKLLYQFKDHHFFELYDNSDFFIASNREDEIVWKKFPVRPDDQKSSGPVTVDKTVFDESTELAPWWMNDDCILIDGGKICLRNTGSEIHIWDIDDHRLRSAVNLNHIRQSYPDHTVRRSWDLLRDVKRSYRGIIVGYSFELCLDSGVMILKDSDVASSRPNVNIAHPVISKTQMRERYLDLLLTDEALDGYMELAELSLGYLYWKE
jgi:hypothetical protein